VGAKDGVVEDLVGSEEGYRLLGIVVGIQDGFVDWGEVEGLNDGKTELIRVVGSLVGCGCGAGVG